MKSSLPIPRFLLASAMLACCCQSDMRDVAAPPPRTVRIADGNVLRYWAPDTDSLFESGDSLVVERAGSTIIINGDLRSSLEYPQTSNLYPTEELRHVYGSVPAVRRMVAQSEDPLVWNHAVRVFDQERNKLTDRAYRRWRKVAGEEATPKAARACAKVLQRSALVDKVSILRAGEDQLTEINIWWCGMEGPDEWLLHPEELSRPLEDADQADLAFDRLTRFLDACEVPGHRALLLYSNGGAAWDTTGTMAVLCGVGHYSGGR